MPLYEYRCENCGRTFEVIQKFSDPPAEHCPSCGKGPVQKLMSSPAIQFKGSGWYITDYAKKDKGTASRGESGTSEKGESGTSEKKGDASKGSSTTTTESSASTDTSSSKKKD